MAHEKNEKHENRGRDEQHSHLSHNSQPEERLLPPGGDYHTLLSFPKAEVIYDITFAQGGLRERMTRMRLCARNKP